jgi:uncharacterized protein (UPF0332 family)
MFDWIQYLRLAQWLCGAGPSPDEEARLRCAVSRAYYAAFGRARRYLVELLGEQDIPTTGEVHEFVINYFREADDTDVALLGSDLDDLRDLRRDADYAPDVGGWPPTATNSLLVAQRVIDALLALPAAPW